LSEGAGAILLARVPHQPATETKGRAVVIERAHPGAYYRRRAEAEQILKGILRDLDQDETDFVISSANGTFIDQAEQGALEHVLPDAMTYTGKPALGESIGSSGLWQVILGAQGLRHGELPPVLHADPSVPLRLSRSRVSLARAQRAVVLSCGINQQAAGLRLAIA
jgi:3-oxoacyl-(acyl-carrier-protein) synthase